LRKRDDEKERRIKESVIQLILQEGFHGVSISKVAKMAEVSPATIYIYFENKEEMLQDIYSEYSDEIFNYVGDRIRQNMNGAELIDVLVRSYYEYIMSHWEIFNFIEQFSGCPSLAKNCTGQKSIFRLYDFISEMKRQQIFREYSNYSVMATIFYPVKAIAVNRHVDERERNELLQEMIRILQNALLIE